MLLSSRPYERKDNPTVERISQGDIVVDLKIATGLADAAVTNDDFDIVDIPFAVILSQECDLEQDFDNHAQAAETNGDKILPTILVCPAYTFNQFKTGKHYVHLNGKTMRPWKSGEPDKLLSNTHHERYHYLKEDTEFSIPELIIDFKHFYTVPRDLMYSIYRSGYKASAKPLFREHISQRFANYLSRIGLPK